MPPYVTRGSWYSQLPPFGWFDPGDRPNSNALGVPDSQQGIALPTRAGLGKWFNVTPPGADRPFPLQQTDTGPAPYTGRGVDISAAAGHQMGYTPKNFPTDANFKVEPIDLTGLGLAAGWGGGVPGDNQTAVAEGPRAGARKMPDTLMDMFQPRSAVDNTPIGIGDALAQNRQSLIGLGMGLLTPRSLAVGAPTGSAMTNALGGYMQGAQADSANAYRQAALAHQKTQDARQAAMDKFNMNLQTQQFAESQKTEAEKLARAAGIAPGTPEHTAFIQKAIQSKTEGDWKVVEVPHPLYPDQKVPALFNARTMETRPFPSSGGAPATAVADAPDIFTSGTPPVYGSGSGGYSTPTPAGGGTAAIPPTAPAIRGRAFPMPPPGVNLGEYNKEKTKEYVKKQAEEERTAKQATMIDPVKEDIGRAINVIQQNPNLTTGVGGQLLSHVGGTKASDLSGLLDTIKANISFEKLNQMRQQSPTGGALGNVSDKDMKTLQAVMGNLEQSKTSGQLLYNLDRIERTRHEIIHGTGTAPPPRFAPPEEQRPASARQTGGSGTGPNADAVRALKANPQYRDQFDAKYGEGAAMRILTGK